MIARRLALPDAPPDTCVYQVDHSDTIVAVGGDWDRFAADNGGGTRCEARQVVGASLWDFIAGDETQHLYGLVLGRVRALGRPVVLPSRCDGPRIRRFLSISITPLEDGAVRFDSTVVRTEARAPVALLDANAPRSLEVVRICSVCKDVHIEGGWVSIEDAITSLGLFDKPTLPRLSHGLCSPCFDDVMTDEG